MVNITIEVNSKTDVAKSRMEMPQASLSDFTIAERLLRRYLAKVIEEGNKLLDKDTDNS